MKSIIDQAMQTKLVFAGAAATVLTVLTQATPAKAVTYLAPNGTSTTQTTLDALDPYITLDAVTYGTGTPGGNFEEYPDIANEGSITSGVMGLWQEAQTGATTLQFWANTGNNPVLSLRLGSSDYIGVVSRQDKTGNDTNAFQWAQIDAAQWYGSGTIAAANNPATYLLWLTTPNLQAASWTTSSDPVVDDLNKYIDPPVNPPTGVPGPLPILALPVLFGFLPKLRRARLMQKSDLAS